jgi:hypothetical protein
MSARTRILRLLGGFALVAVILVVTFSLLPSWIHYWGATDQEIARSMPGDELLPNPTVEWTHGVTIDAPPEEVWPWIAQLGEGRGGFYSYTFIENLIAGEGLYHNANRIIPELQDPAVGEVLIGTLLDVEAVEPGQWLLGSGPPEFRWTWVWALYPHGDGQTRLVVRMHIESEETAAGSFFDYAADVGGFVMERKMVQGIKDRAEGRFEPAYTEVVEIVVWVVALIVGILAGILFLIRPAWQQSLAAGVAAVLTLLYFTFGQPVLRMRILIDICLIAGLVLGFRSKANR